VFGITLDLALFLADRGEVNARHMQMARMKAEDVGLGGHSRDFKGLLVFCSRDCFEMGYLSFVGGSMPISVGYYMYACATVFIHIIG
jgi:hypothetical protein